jgi:hypothetical protein
MSIGGVDAIAPYARDAAVDENAVAGIEEGRHGIARHLIDSDL